MNILLVQMATKEIEDRFYKKHQLQPKNEAWEKYDKLLVTDDEMDVSPYEDFIIKRPGLRQPHPLNGVMMLNRALAWNTGIEYGEQHGYDAVIIMGGDTVIYNFPSFIDEHKIGSPKFLEGLIPHHEKLDPRIGVNVSWATIWIIPKPLLYLRLCEDFLGDGFEDTDFDNNIVRASGIEFCKTDIEISHIAHQRNISKEYDADIYNYNKDIYLRRG